MNQNTNNLITKHSFCKNEPWDVLFTVAKVCKVRSHGSNESNISISVHNLKTHCHVKL